MNRRACFTKSRKMTPKISVASSSAELSSVSSKESLPNEFKKIPSIKYGSLKVKKGLTFEVVLNSLENKQKVEARAGKLFVTICSKPNVTSKQKTKQQKKRGWSGVTVFIKINSGQPRLRKSRVIVTMTELACQNANNSSPQEPLAVIKRAGRVTAPLTIQFPRSKEDIKKGARISFDVKFPLKSLPTDYCSYYDLARQPVMSRNAANHLFESREETGDALIRTAEGRQTRIHACVLAAQSEVLKAFFDTRKKEGQEMLVKIDGQFDIVLKFVEYLYLGYTKEVVKQPKLFLEIGHIFKVESLVKECWCILMKTLSPDTVVPLLLLAEKTADVKNKHEIAKYLLDNHKIIRKTAAYADLITERPSLYLEICGM